MIQFPDRDNMTPEEVAANEAAAKTLVRGQYYRFKEPVTATAIPTGGITTCALEECEFERGWYIGFVDGQHIFQGKPINDQRIIPVPKGYERSIILDLEKIMQLLRESYFPVLFTGGPVAILDSDQNLS